MKVSGFLDDQFDILLQKQSNNKEDENNNNSKESKIKFLVSSVQSKKYVTPLDTLRLTKDDLKSTLKHVSGDNRRVKAVWDVILDKDYFDSDVYLYYFAKFKDGRFLKNVFHTKDQLLFPYYYLDIDLLAEYLNNSKPFSLHPIADFPKEIIKTKTEAEVNAFFTLLLENYHVYWSHYDQLLIVFIQVFRYLDVAIVRHVYQTIERLSLFREGFLPIPLSFYEFKERPLEVLEFLQSTGRFNIQFGDIEAMSYNQLLFCLNKGMVTLTAMSAGFPHIKKVVEMYTQKQFDKLREYAYRYLNVGSNMKQFDPCIPLQSIEVDELFHIGMQGSIKVIDCFMRLHFPTEKETTKRLEYLSQLLNGVLVGRHMNILEHLHKYYDHVFITQPNNEYRKDCPFFPQKVISLFLYEVKRIPRMFVFLKELTTKIE